jgi:hypothetical protein
MRDYEIKRRKENRQPSYMCSKCKGIALQRRVAQYKDGDRISKKDVWCCRTCGNVMAVK